MHAHPSPTAPRRPRHIAGVVLTLLAGSLLACAGGGLKVAGDSYQAEPTPPPSSRQRPERQPEQSEEFDAPEAPAPPGAQTYDGPPEPDAPLESVSMTPIEEQCEDGDAEACREFALSLLKGSPDGAEHSRAAMSMFRACELDSGAGCYEYGLMTWMRVGVPYDKREITYAFERARRLKEPRAERDYRELVAPPDPDDPPSEATRFHLSEACALSMRQACGALAANGGAPVKEAVPEAQVEIPPAQPQPQPTAPAEPEVVLEEKGLSVSGALTKQQVRGALAPRRVQLQLCYEETLAESPDTTGLLVATMIVSDQGAVESVMLDGSSFQGGVVLPCMERMIKGWRLLERGKTADGETTVVYMVEFSTK